jgi:hypothetical protein
MPSSQRPVALNYLQQLAADIRAELPPDVLPDGDVDGLLLLYAVLARAKGTSVTAEDVHDAWAAWASTRAGTHRSLRPFSDLPLDVQAQDEPFVAALRRVAGRRDRAAGTA